MRDSAILKLAAVAGLLGFGWTFVTVTPKSSGVDGSVLSNSRFGGQRTAEQRAAFIASQREALLAAPTDLRHWQRLASVLAFEEDPFEATRAWLAESPAELVERGGAGLLWYWVGRQYGSEEDGFDPAEHESRAREMWRIAGREFKEYVLAHPREAALVHWRLFGYSLKRTSEPDAAQDIFLRTADEALRRVRMGEEPAGAGLGWTATLLRDSAESGGDRARALRAYRERFDRIARESTALAAQDAWTLWERLFHDLISDGEGGLADAVYPLERLEDLQRAAMQAAVASPGEDPAETATTFFKRAQAWERIAFYWGLIDREERAQRAWREAVVVMEWATEARAESTGLYELARYRAIARDREGALDALERAIALGWDQRQRMEREEAFEQLWSEPRFGALLERIPAPKDPRVRIR